MISLGDALLKLGVDSKDLEKGMADAEKNIDKYTKRLGLAMMGVGTAITGALIGATIKTASLGDEIAKMSKRTGVGTVALSELRYAANLSGTSLQGLETAIKRMQVSLVDASQSEGDLAKKLAKATAEGNKQIAKMKEAGATSEELDEAQKALTESLAEMAEGGSEATEAIETLGLNLSDLLAMSPEQQFYALAGAIAAIDDPTTRAGMAIKIFGRAGTDMLPMLSEGAAGLEKMKKEAHELGIIFDEEAAKKAEAFMDATERLKESLGKAGAAIGTSLMGPLTDLLENKLVPIIQKFADWTEKNPELVKNLLILGSVLIGVGGFVFALSQVSKAIIAINTALIIMRGLMVGTAGISAAATTGTVAITGLTRAFTGLGAFFLTNPLGIALAALATIGTLALIATDKVKTLNSELENWEQKTSEALSPAGRVKSAFGSLGLTPEKLAEAKAVLEANEARTPPTVAPSLNETEKNWGMNEWRATMGLPPLPGFAFGGIIPGPIGQPVPIMAHGGEEFLGVQNIGRSTGNTIIINPGILPGDEVTLRKFMRAVKEMFGEDSRRNSFGPVNQGYFYGRSSV